jgi:hypothetical protein
MKRWGILKIVCEIFIAMVITIAIADGATTYYALAAFNFVEKNPLIAGTVNAAPITAIFIQMPVIFAIVISWTLWHRKPRAERANKIFILMSLAFLVSCFLIRLAVQIQNMQTLGWI